MRLAAVAALLMYPSESYWREGLEGSSIAFPGEIFCRLACKFLSYSRTYRIGNNCVCVLCLLLLLLLLFFALSFWTTSLRVSLDLFQSNCIYRPEGLKRKKRKERNETEIRINTSTAARFVYRRHISLLVGGWGCINYYSYGEQQQQQQQLSSGGSI